MFVENGFEKMMKIAFNASPYTAINTAYPDRFKPWEFNMTTKGYWNLETGIKATKWLIEEKLKLTDEELCNTITGQVFFDNGLDGMLNAVFNASPYKAINAAYPNKFKPWEIKQTPSNYWSLETGAECVRWLIEEKLKLNDDEIREEFSLELFKEHGLMGMLSVVFKNKPYDAINAAYPNKFKPWEFRVGQGFWNVETGIEATKWLIEEKLKLSDEEIRNNISYKLFKENGYEKIIKNAFNGDAYKAIRAAYPNKF